MLLRRVYEVKIRNSVTQSYADDNRLRYSYAYMSVGVIMLRQRRRW